MIIDELFEAPQQCPECGGISFSDLILAEKKDACYYKVKASAKVWPSAYASGRLVQCRKKGASNYGNKSEGVAEGTDQINEYRNRLLQYVKGLLPTWPEYVLKDWLVPNKGDFSNLPDNELKNGIMEKLNSAGLTPNTKWQLVPNMKFTMDMFNPMSKKRLIGRAGGHSDMGLDVPRDKERHATQAALARQQGGIRKEPVLLIQTPQGYVLLEGWHRTIQHFAMYPDGYTGPAYIAVAQGQQGVTEGSLEEGVNDPHIFKAIAMIGPMGAGKSTIAQQLVGGSGLRSLNLDNFNELLIKQGKVAGGNLTPDQLERSWQLTQAQKGNWVDGRLGLLIDGSGRNVEGLVKPLTQLEALGYDTMVILVNVSLETSLQRQQSRAAQQAQQYGTGRNVPADLAKSSYDQIQQNIPKLQQLYGNKLLIINNEGAVDLTQEKTIVDRFLSAPPSKPAAVEWIKSQGASQGQQLDKRLAQQQRQQSAAQRAPTYKQQGVAEEQELDEKWSQKYKSSINCANPKGFSQKAHCAGRNKNEDVAEGVMYGAENLHVGDDVIVSGDVNLNGATGVIDSFGQDKRFVVVDLYNHGKHSFHSSDVSANDHDNDEHDDLDETRKGQVPMTLKPGETDNIEPEDSAGFKKLPAYKQGQQAQQSRGKDLIQQSPYTYQSDQDWAYRNGAFDQRQAAVSADFAKRGPLTTAEGEQQKGADYRDPKKVDYNKTGHDDSVRELKRLAGLGPREPKWDPEQRRYRMMPTAVQPKK